MRPDSSFGQEGNVGGGAASLDGDAGSFAVRMNADGSTDATFAGGSGLLFGAGASLRFDARGGVDTSYGIGGLTPPSVAGAFVPDGRASTCPGATAARRLPFSSAS